MRLGGGRPSLTSHLSGLNCTGSKWPKQTRPCGEVTSGTEAALREAPGARYSPSGWSPSPADALMRAVVHRLPGPGKQTQIPRLRCKRFMKDLCSGEKGQAPGKGRVEAEMGRVSGGDAGALATCQRDVRAGSNFWEMSFQGTEFPGGLLRQTFPRAHREQPCLAATPVSLMDGGHGGPSGHRCAASSCAETRPPWGLKPGSWAAQLREAPAPQGQEGSSPSVLRG